MDAHHGVDLLEVGANKNLECQRIITFFNFEKNHFNINPLNK
jgi:hypothetical protein